MTSRGMQDSYRRVEESNSNILDLSTENMNGELNHAFCARFCKLKIDIGQQFHQSHDRKLAHLLLEFFTGEIDEVTLTEKAKEIVVGSS